MNENKLPKIICRYDESLESYIVILDGDMVYIGENIRDANMFMTQARLYIDVLHHYIAPHAEAMSKNVIKDTCTEKLKEENRRLYEKIGYLEGKLKQAIRGSE